MTTMKAVLTRTQFRGWLERQQPTAVVGYANNSARCPLAAYLKDVLLNETVRVHKRDVWRDDMRSGRSAALPMWAYHFERRIDLLASPPYTSPPITREQAIELLEVTT